MARGCACGTPARAGCARATSAGGRRGLREVDQDGPMCDLFRVRTRPGSRPEVAMIEPAIEVDPGVPGASARREFERRAARREEQVRTKHNRLGGLILAVSDDPQSTRAWDTGAIGEERLGTRLNELAGDSLHVVHDRKIPRSTADIDHLAVTPNGVFVIDASATAVGPGRRGRSDPATRREADRRRT